MMKFWAGLVVALVVFMPVSVSAKTISVTRTITVTASVAPMRSIVVNDQGQMTKIYSNTSENVEPKVYLNDVPGEPRPLTPALMTQYKKVISEQKNLVGVEIPVERQVAEADTVRSFLMKTVGTLTRSIPL